MVGRRSRDKKAQLTTARGRRAAVQVTLLLYSALGLPPGEIQSPRYAAMSSLPRFALWARIVRVDTVLAVHARVVPAATSSLCLFSRFCFCSSGVIHHQEMAPQEEHEEEEPESGMRTEREDIGVLRYGAAQFGACAIEEVFE